MPCHRTRRPFSAITWDAPVAFTFLLSIASAQRYGLGYTSDNAAIETLHGEGVWQPLASHGTYAQFSINKSSIEGEVAVARMNGSISYGCEENSIPRSPGKIVVIQRGHCRFLLKAWYVHLSGAIAMIVVDHDDRSTPPIMSSGMEPIPTAMLGLVSLAVRHSLGQDLISTSTTDGPKFIRISYAEPSRGSIKPIRDSHAGRVISYTCGVAISAIFLVMATRMYHRGPGHRRNAAIIAALADADRDIPECDDLLKSLECYTFDREAYLASTMSSSDNAPNPSETSKDVINADPDGVATSRNDGDVEADDVPTCCICLAQFENSEHILRLPCKHEFHDGCISTWLRRHCECPLCKANVYEMHRNLNEDFQPLASVNVGHLDSLNDSEVLREVETVPHVPEDAGVTTVMLQPRFEGAREEDVGKVTNDMNPDEVLYSPSQAASKPRPNLDFSDSESSSDDDEVILKRLTPAPERQGESVEDGELPMVRGFRRPPGDRVQSVAVNGVIVDVSTL